MSVVRRIGGVVVMVAGIMGSVTAHAEPAAQSQSAELAGISSSIKTIYVVNHAHLDIGFTDVPSAVAASYKTMIDAQLSFALSHTDYKFAIEETWQLEQWLKRTTNQAQITQLTQLVTAGRVSVGAGHSTLHSGKASWEEVSRLLWNAARYRSTYGIPVQTLFQDDVPGVAWSYAQVLARSGIKYLVCGENTFIGGGFTQPYTSFPFYWQGPDGSRVLTWSTRKGYAEAFDDTSGYGLPFFAAGQVNATRLAASMQELTNAGYPYDALMIQSAFDNAYSTAPYDAIVAWNAANANPKFVLATPEDFFKYLEQKYGSQIPTREGNWTSSWDTNQQVEPQGDKVCRNAQSQLPASEKMWAFASALGFGTYPSDQFSNAWDMALTLDEHSGAGGCWDGYWTQAQVDQNNNEYRNFTLNLQSLADTTRASGEQALLDAAALPDHDCIVVFNPLSWARDAVARVSVPAQVLAQRFTLVDRVTGQVVPCQKDAAASQILFIASNVPAVGYKRYVLKNEAPPAVTTGLSSGSNWIENSRYRITVDTHGTISSLYDRLAGRELVNTTAAVRFNQSSTATNLEQFFGVSNPVPDPASSTVSVTATGPVAVTLRIENATHAISATEITLYEGLDRIDILNTPDRSKMTYANYDTNSRYYAMVFPFNLISSRVRVDTPAGWLDPASTETLAGSYIGAHTPQHGVDLSENGYGVTFATPDVFSHSFGGIQTPGYTPSLAPTVYSRFIRYGNECKLKGGAIGTVNAEPGTSPRWDIRYALRSHTRAFDAVAEARFGWEVCTPASARYVTAAANAKLITDSCSFIRVDKPNVVISSVKRADFGAGLILTLQEIGEQPMTEVMVQSDVLSFNRVTETTPLETDLQDLPLDTSSIRTSFAVSVKANEQKTLRLDYTARFAAAESGWELYE